MVQSKAEKLSMERSIVPQSLVLTGDNYQNWSACIKNYLIAHDMWAIVDIVEANTKPPNPQEVVEANIEPHNPQEVVEANTEPPNP